jgi:hypothetical protein
MFFKLQNQLFAEDKIDLAETNILIKRAGKIQSSEVVKQGNIFIGD